MTSPSDFSQWLKTATKGLPPQTQRLLRDELTAHYEDALEDHLERGSDAIFAHEAALAQLGSAHDLRLQFCRTFPRRRYLRASLLSTIWLLCLVLAAVATPLPLTLFGIISVACTSYVLRSLVLLSEHQAAQIRIRPFIAAIEVCSVLVIALSSITLSSPRDYPFIVMLTDPFILPSPTLYAQELTGVHILLAVSIGGIGVGWILTSERLISQRSGLFGMGMILSTAMLISGLSLVGAGFGLLLRNDYALTLLCLAIAVTGVSRQALLSFIFFRASMQGSPQPWQGLHA